MSRPELQLAHVATEFASTIVADAWREDNLGELRLHGGDNPEFHQFTVLKPQASDETAAYYTGLTVTGPAQENYSDLEADAVRLQHPTDRPLWGVSSISVRLPLVVATGPRAEVTNEGFCYFWQNDNGSWSTDIRRLANPVLLGAMAQEKMVRARLIDAATRLGGDAVRTYLAQVAEETNTQFPSNESLLAKNTIELMHQFRTGERPDPRIGYPLYAVLGSLR